MDELIRDIGALLVGKRTFGGDDPHRGTEKEGKAFGGGWSGPQFVLTHHIPAASRPRRCPMSPSSGTSTAGVAAAKAAAGDRYVNILGASVARQCLEAGVLDEVLTFVAPVLLGDGVRLFDHPGGTDVSLERIRLHHTPHSTDVWYRVVR